MTPDILLDGLRFPEGPRWRGDRLWFVDMFANSVHSTDLAGNVQKVADIPIPVGLGWAPDGDLLVTSPPEGKLLAVDGGGTVSTRVDLAALGFRCGEMVVDDQGRCFAGGSLVDVEHRPFDESIPPGPGNMPGFGHMMCVDSVAGTGRIVADRVTFPNGSVLTPDGKTLIVAETMAFRLTAFDIESDGSLSNRRVWADLGVPPDGICLDEEGCIWVAVIYYQYGGTGGYIRVEEGGRVLEQIDVDGYSPYACTLGGPDRKTLILCESATFGQPRNPGDGRIRVIDVDVPGTGSP